MTTIAYHYGDGQIAVDSRITAGGRIVSDSDDKTIKNKIGLWFFSGDASDCADLAVLNHNDKVSAIPECAAFLIVAGNVYLVVVNDDMYCQHSFLDYNYAIGSGGDFALAAMDFGKSAKEAVKYAMTRNCYSGGKVRVFKV